jgi:hypothetical protein
MRRALSSHFSFAWIGEPVLLLQAAGIIEAFQIPVIAFLTLAMTRKLLPSPLRPGMIAGILTAGAGLFYLFFALFYAWAKLVVERGQ